MISAVCDRVQLMASLSRSRLDQADESGEVSFESGEVINERVAEFLKKKWGNEKRGHLRVCFRRFVTKLQKEFFNKRLPKLTGSIYTWSLSFV